MASLRVESRHVELDNQLFNPSDNSTDALATCLPTRGVVDVAVDTARIERIGQIFESVRNNAQQAAAALSSVTAPNPTANFASGGFAPRGTDTIAAALSNARSTQRFFSQIQSINAGQAPVFRSEGGPVTVGDINVTNVSSGNAQVDGKTIATVLNRELRKGTIRIRR